MASSNISDTTSRWNHVSVDIRNQLSFLDPQGLFIVCKCCEMFGRVSDKSVNSLKKEYGRVKLRHAFTVTDRWHDHIANKMHEASEKKYQQMLDDEKESDPKKRKNPVTSAVASPPITNFFAGKKKKDRKTDEDNSNTRISSTVMFKPLPLYHTQCSGIFSIHEVMGSSTRHSGDRKELLQLGLKIRQKYFLENGLHVVDVVPGTVGVLNLFAMDCASYATNDKIQVEGQFFQAINCGYGFRCTNCHKYNNADSRKIHRLRTKVIEKVGKWQKLENISSGSVVFDKETTMFIKSQSKIDKKLLTIEGQSIIATATMLKTLFFKQENELKKRISHSDEFVQEFIDFYEKHPSFRNGLAGQIVQSRAKNAYSSIPPRLMDFFCLVSNIDRKAGEIVSAQFDGPSVFGMVKHKKKTAGFAERKHIVCRDKDDWIMVMKDYVEKTYSKQENFSFSVAIDASKVAKALQIDFRYNAVLGGAVDKHFIAEVISDSNHSQEALKKLKTVLQDDSIKKADEIKVAVVVFQNTGFKSPYLILASRPQTTNEVSSFSDDICSALSEFAKQQSTSERVVHFLNSANDAVSCDKAHVVQNIKDFLHGSINYLGTTDINHNGKNARTQIVGFNTISTIGSYVLDVGILAMSGVPMDLIRIADWASDKLVLDLSSVKVCKRIMNSKSSDLESRTVMSLTLLIQRAHLFAVNFNGNICNKDRVQLLWASMIYFIHLDGVSIITKRNWIMGCIANCFLMMRSDVVEPHQTTSEPCEHVFGHSRSINREYTVKVWGEIVRKLHERFRLIYKNGFQCTREPGKGYASLAKAGNDRNKKNEKKGGPIDMSDARILNDKHAFLIWKDLRIIVNETNQTMRKFLSNLGIKSFHRLTKSFKEPNLGNPEELLQDFLLCMENAERGDYDPCVGDYEDENEDNDTAIAIEAKDVDELQNEFEKKVTLGCMVEAKNTNNEDELPIEADIDQMEVDDYAVEVCDDYQEESPNNFYKHAWPILRTLLEMNTLKEIVEADISTDFQTKESKLEFAFRCMEMKGQERCSIGKGVQGFKSLNGRYYPKVEKDIVTDLVKKDEDHTKSTESVKRIERGCLLKLKDYDGFFVVIGVGMKFHNKWFHLSNSQERPIWPPKSKKLEKKFRIHLRKIFQDKFGVANFENYNEISDHREKEKKFQSYVAIGDLNDIEEVYDLNSIMKK